MALIDTSDMDDIMTALGAADALLQAQLVNSGTTVTTLLKESREKIRLTLTEADIDNATAWQSAIRQLERNLPNQLGPSLANAVNGMDAYYLQQTGKRLREQFKTYTGWTDAFRALWRRVKREELIVRLASITNTGGTWGSLTADKTITLDTGVELRTASTIANQLTATVRMRKADGVTEQVSAITIPPGTTSGTVFDISGAFTTVVSVSVSAGLDGNILAIWTR